MLKTIGMELSEDQFQEMIAAADTDGRFVSPFGRGSGGASVVVRLRVVVVADHMRYPRVHAAARHLPTVRREGGTASNALNGSSATTVVCAGNGCITYEDFLNLWGTGSEEGAS